MRGLRRSFHGLIVAMVLAAGLAVAPAPAEATSCDISYGSYHGQYVCEYGTDNVWWPDGHFQVFFVGTDYAVWTIYEVAPYSGVYSGWIRLGGTARSGVWHFNLSWTTIAIGVIGTDGNAWYNYWNQSYGWSGWTSWYCGC
jgi:hypothetical protein